MNNFFKNKNAKAIQWGTHVAGNIGYLYAKGKNKFWPVLGKKIFETLGEAKISKVPHQKHDPWKKNTDQT